MANKTEKALTLVAGSECVCWVCFRCVCVSVWDSSRSLVCQRPAKNRAPNPAFPAPPCFFQIRSDCGRVHLSDLSARLQCSESFPNEKNNAPYKVWVICRRKCSIAKPAALISHFQTDNAPQSVMCRWCQRLIVSEGHFCFQQRFDCYFSPFFIWIYAWYPDVISKPPIIVGFTY